MSIRRRILEHPLADRLVDQLRGVACHAVGGTVRDALLGVSTRDLDVSVSEEGERIARDLGQASAGRMIKLGGDRFASYRIVASEFQADIWDRLGGSLRADLERRDLTINSIAVDFASADALEDPFGGRADLEAGLLRATRLDCFERDPLRVLRLARFRVQLAGFSIGAETASAARAARAGLTSVAKERVRDELRLILSRARAARGFHALDELGLLPVLFPSLAGRTEGLIERAAGLDEALSALGRRPSLAKWDELDRWQAAVGLLAGSGSSDPSEAAGELERTGHVTRGDARAAGRLCEARIPGDDDARRLFLADQGERWGLALALAAARAGLSVAQVDELAGRIEHTLDDSPDLRTAPAPLVDGTSTARILGVEPGPEVGRALRALIEAQILGRIRTRAEAEEFLRRRAGAASDPTSKSPSSAG